MKIKLSWDIVASAFELNTLIENRSEKIVDIEIPTAALIAELENRRPCEKCAENRPESCCGKCVFYFGPIENNFKPAK